MCEAQGKDFKITIVMCQIFNKIISNCLSPKGTMDQVPLEKHFTGDEDLAVHCTAPKLQL